MVSLVSLRSNFLLQSFVVLVKHYKTRWKITPTPERIWMLFFRIIVTLKLLKEANLMGDFEFC